MTLFYSLLQLYLYKRCKCLHVRRTHFGKDIKVMIYNMYIHNRNKNGNYDKNNENTDKESNCFGARNFPSPLLVESDNPHTS